MRLLDTLLDTFLHSAGQLSIYFCELIWEQWSVGTNLQNPGLKRSSASIRTEDLIPQVIREIKQGRADVVRELPSSILLLDHMSQCPRLLKVFVRHTCSVHLDPTVPFLVRGERIVLTQPHWTEL